MRKHIIFIGFVLWLCTGCKKLIEIGQPVDSITTAETFTTDANAIAALMSIYDHLSYNQGALGYGNGRMTVQGGLSSDELNGFDQGEELQFQVNQVLADNSLILGVLWSPMYADIYRANAILEGLEISSTISAGVKAQVGGEARFLRAFIYFYLVNLYGDIPLVTSTNYKDNAYVARAATSKVYELIISDLQQAITLLPNNYAVSGEQRIRPNRYAAKALLARTHLFLGDWQAAETEATDVINNTGLYSIVTDLNQVFQRGSTEAIWQLQVVDDEVTQFATIEGRYLCDSNAIAYYLTPELLAAFEANDQRKLAWVNTVDLNQSGTIYPYAYKYKVFNATESQNVSEDYMVLRLAEQYLIRAEARAKQNNAEQAIGDLNVIRARADLANLPTSLTSEEIALAIEQERRVELFAEWGHRWLDLKRTGRANAVLGPLKGANWQPTDQLYPIPQKELQSDPNLTQNEGYN